MTYKTDYHIHTTFSDGKEAPGEYIAPAVSAGLSEIGFSEHMTLFRGPFDWSLGEDDAGRYLGYISALARKEKRIKVKKGMEVEYFPGKEKELFSFLEPLDLDYVIGSVHFIGDMPVDNGPEFYEGKNVDDIYMSYFSLVEASAASGLFDIIGHCDLVKIYGLMPSFGLDELYRKLAISFRRYDVAFEINTNGRNRPVGDFYPDRRFLRIFCEENVPVCVNSDGHMPSRVGQYFDEAYQLLKDAGYTEMAVFNKRERFMIPF